MKKDYRKEYYQAVKDVEEYSLTELGFEAINDVIKNSKSQSLVKEATEYRNYMIDDCPQLINNQ